MVPNSRRLDRILIIARLRQPAASAIWEVVNSPLLIISLINSSVDLARFGTMVHCATSVVSCEGRRVWWECWTWGTEMTGNTQKASLYNNLVFYGTRPRNQGFSLTMLKVA